MILLNCAPKANHQELMLTGCKWSPSASLTPCLPPAAAFLSSLDAAPGVVCQLVTSEARRWAGDLLDTTVEILAELENSVEADLGVATNRRYNHSMRFEWDEDKRLVNVRKHAIDFHDAVEIFHGSIVTVEDDRFEYPERRFVTLGLLRGRVIAVVHTERGDASRIISARRATKYERTTYFKRITD